MQQPHRIARHETAVNLAKSERYTLRRHHFGKEDGGNAGLWQATAQQRYVWVMSGFQCFRAGARAASLLAVLVCVGCAHDPAPQPVYTWGPAYAQPAAGTPAATAPSPPGQVVATPGAITPAAPTLQPVSANDPINNHDLTFLRQRAAEILNALVAALPPPQQARVNGIPLVVDSTPGEVNAFATCSGSSAAMAITDGLLQIQSQLARFRAYKAHLSSGYPGRRHLLKDGGQLFLTTLPWHWQRLG